jgi:flagellin
MRINNNIMAMNALRYTSAAESSQSKSMQKLSSGLAINSAADDAAGLSISEKMRAQINGLDQASENAQDGISMMQTAEGALDETTSMLQRMRELAVQASNSTLEDEDRTAIGEEMKALAEEIDRISTDTEFNGQKLLDGSLTTTVDTTTTNAAIGDGTITYDASTAKAGTVFTFSAVDTNDTDAVTLSATVDGVTTSQTLTASDIAVSSEGVLDFDGLGIEITIATGDSVVLDAVNDIAADLAGKQITTSADNSAATFAIGANEGQNITVAFGDMGADKLGDASNLKTLVQDVDADSIVDTTAKAQTLITELDGAIADVSTQRGKFGATQNRLEYTINNLSTTSENLTAAESRIRDVDMAEEMMNYTKVGILQQASQAMLAQANQLPQGTLQLLQ